MCRGCVILFFLFIIAESLSAQPIHLAQESLELNITDSTEIVELQNYVINDLGQTAPIQWQKNFTAPDSWTVNLCDDFACFGETLNSNVLYIDSGDSSQLKGQFFITEPGEGQLNVTVTALDSNGDTYSIQTSYTVTKLTETSIVDIQQSIKVYPNPSTDKLYILNDKYNHYSLTDLKGVTILRNKLVQGNNLLSIENINSGLYVLQLYTDNKTHSVLVQKL